MAKAAAAATMVSKRRYNSVERFTSVHLSEYEQQQLMPRPATVVAQQQQLMMAPVAAQQRSVPSPTEAAAGGGQQPQNASLHPFAQMRQRSPEQLPAATPAPPTPSMMRPASQFGTGDVPHPQPLTTGPPSPASTSIPFPHPQPSQQPIPSHPYNQQQQQPYAQTRAQPQPRNSAQLQPPQLHPLNRINPYQQQSTAVTPQPQFGARPTIRQYVPPKGQRVAANNGTSSFFLKQIPAPIWLSLSVLEVIAGIVSLFIGALNASPYNCMIQPNVPVYLILSGVLLILNGGARIFLGLGASSSSAKHKKRQTRQMPAEGQKSGESRFMWAYAIEALGLFSIVVVVILGCVWVYGASRYMHSQMYMFERHFCEHTLYWTAWWSVTIHLGAFALLILLSIVVLVFGAITG